MADEDLVKIGMACGDIADALYPDAADRPLRQKLALSLVDLSRLVIRQSEAAATVVLEPRVVALEKDSHPPVELASIIVKEVTRAIQSAKLRVLTR